SRLLHVSDELVCSFGNGGTLDLDIVGRPSPPELSVWGEDSRYLHRNIHGNPARREEHRKVGDRLDMLLTFVSAGLKRLEVDLTSGGQAESSVGRVSFNVSGGHGPCYGPVKPIPG